MPNNISNISFQSPYDAEAQEIERRRQMAQALQQQGMTPMGGTETIGGWAIKKSPLEGLAKMLQAYSGRKGQDEAGERQKALGERYQSDLARTLMQAQAAGTGAPASTEQIVDEQAAGGDGAQAQINAPAIAPDRQAMARILMGHPATQGVGMQAMLKGLEPKKPMVVGRSLLGEDGRVIGQDATWQAEQEAARKAREAEQGDRRTEAQRAEAARIAEAQRAEQARFDQQRQIAQLIASNRQPNQPQVIQTAQGPMVLGPNGQAQPITGPGGAVVKPAAGRGGPMTATAQKELIETEEAMQGGQAALGLFKQAKDLNDKAMGFTGAGALASAGSLIPEALRPNAVDATQNLDNILQTAALPQLKAIFGGMPTEGERKILLDVQGSSSKPAKVRAEIFKRAEEAIQARIKFAGEKAKRLRDGTYFSGDGLPSLQPEGGGRSAQDTAALEWANANPNDPRAAAIKQRLGAR